MYASAYVALTALVGVPALVPSQASPGHYARSAWRQTARLLTFAQITGTYKVGNDRTLDVQVLPGGKVRFRFVGLANLRASGSPNLDDAAGTFMPHHNTAAYYDKDDGGRMILRFAPRWVFLSQASDLGFGAGVVAEGIY